MGTLNQDYFDNEGIVFKTTDSVNNIAEEVTSEDEIRAYWENLPDDDNVGESGQLPEGDIAKTQEKKRNYHSLKKVGGVALVGTIILAGSYAGSYVAGDAAIKFGTFRHSQITVDNLKSDLEKNIAQQMDHFWGGDK